MISRFNFNSRVLKHLQHLAALSALNDDEAVDARWLELKRDVYNEAHAAGYSAKTDAPCVIPEALLNTPLAGVYQQAYLDGYLQSCVSSSDKEASWMPGISLQSAEAAL